MDSLLLQLNIMIARPPKALSFLLLFFSIFLGFFGYAFSGESQTEDNAMTEDIALIGNIEAGEERYKKSCINCHGAAGKGAASYPKISGNDVSYTKSRLETYRDGIKIGPNSSLMIMMAKPLTDEEIVDLATYLKDAT